MTLLSRIALSTVAGAVLIAGAASASAVSMIREAPVETAAATATQVGYHSGYHYGGYRRGYGYDHHCFWKKKRFWGYYGYYFKRVKVCF